MVPSCRVIALKWTFSFFIIIIIMVHMDLKSQNAMCAMYNMASLEIRPIALRRKTMILSVFS